MSPSSSNTVNKLDHAPLLDAGIKYMSMSVLRTIAVEPFNSSERRNMLFQNLEFWIKKAQEIGISGEILIDGSFVTEKIDPDDIDCVLIINSLPQNPSENSIQEISTHINHQLNHVTFLLDMYPLMSWDPETQEFWIPYWRGWFGFCRDGLTAKGIARIEI